MSRKKKHAEHVNHERWLVSYADFITLLFAFFVVMFAVSQVDTKKVGRFTESFSHAVGIITAPAGDGIMPGEIVIKAANSRRVSNGAQNGDDHGDQLSALQASLNEKAKLGGHLARIKIVRRGNELVLRLDATVLFDSGEVDVREAARPVLKAMAAELNERDVLLRVEGHTDDVPITNARYRSNWDLSTARATSAVVELATAGGMDPKRLAAMGYAEYQPIAPNDSPEGRTQNRRVDFVVSVRSE